jgi:hypothetical protein
VRTRRSLRALAAQAFEQGQQRALAVVQRDVVEMVEYPRLGQLAQLGIDEAAAEHGDDGRILRLDRLRDAEGAIDIAGKGCREQHHAGRVAPQRVERQLAQRAIDQVFRRRQRPRQRFERGLALRQRFGIADELEARIDRLAQHVGDIIEVQGGKVPRAVRHAERAEGPGQRIAARFVGST